MVGAFWLCGLLLLLAKKKSLPKIELVYFKSPLA